MSAGVGGRFVGVGIGGTVGVRALVQVTRMRADSRSRTFRMRG